MASYLYKEPSLTNKHFGFFSYIIEDWSRKTESKEDVCYFAVKFFIIKSRDFLGMVKR